ncbi:hypothetical protein [Ramlibacter humi]|uniref:hypothetical protein n=1 Tax=Ramlibacter humi TaxID=2530451 RepID=UPI001980C51C|nr:hypothetical protein [Ramlibacter humi]
MAIRTTAISSLADLSQALSQPEPCNLQLQTSVLSPYSITLPPGFVLSGRDQESCVLSFSNGDGVGLTADNRIENLTVLATPACRAIYTQAGMADMGRIALSGLSVTGQVSLIARSGTTKLKLDVDRLHVAACDCRRYSEQPQKYGVNVYQGALTVYNFNGDPDSAIHASLTNITVGSRGAPVIGSGVFVSGFGDHGGWVELDQLTTGAVYSNGMLPYGTADIITAGVFVVYGVRAKRVEHFGEIVTYGVNDMVLDTWGSVDSWLAHAPITSYGPSGIGFVNFGTVGDFVAEHEVVTHGLGARGFNQYDGTVRHIRFRSIETFGDGSIGVQVSKPVGTIVIEEGITTHGSVGNTLVKGVNMLLPAEAFSVKPGGVVDSLRVGADLVTHGANVTTFAVEGGKVNAIDIKGEVVAHGDGSDAVMVSKKGTAPMANVRAVAKSGRSFVVEQGG